MVALLKQYIVLLNYQTLFFYIFFVSLYRKHVEYSDYLYLSL